MEKLLQDVILNGNVTEILQLLLQQNVDIKTVNEVGDTALHLALRNNKLLQNETIEILDVLINRGVDCNVKNHKQETALHLAITKWDKEIVDYLLKHNAKIDVTDDKGYSVLHFFIRNMLERFVTNLNFNDGRISFEQNLSIEKESAEFVEWLLLKGFDFDVKNKEDESALQLAIEYNLQHIVPSLLKHTRDINFVTRSDKRTLLQLFLIANAEGKHPYREDKKEQLKNQQYSFIPMVCVHYAAFSQLYDIEIVKILFTKGVSFKNRDRYGHTAFEFLICMDQTIDLMALILDCFAKSEDQCKYSLACVTFYYFLMNMGDCSEHYYELYDVYKNLRATIDENNADSSGISTCGHNLLHPLAMRNTYCEFDHLCHEEIFDYLITEGCDVNARSCEGRTPLHFAADAGNIIVMKKLIAHEVDVNSRDFVKNWTPLHLASAKKQASAEVVKLLVDSGAQVNSNSLTVRPIHLAADCKNNSETLKMLLKCGAEVNVRDFQDNSALCIAIRIDCAANIEALLAYGADINDISVIQLLREINKNSAAKECMIHHLIKLKAAKLLCSGEYESFDGQRSGEFHETCLKEVEKLKITYVDSHISLYQWLHMDPYRRFLYFHSEKLQRLIDSSTLVEQFPQYSTTILGFYRETEARKIMFTPAKHVWLTLTQINLPDVCLERIFIYLNTGFLFEFIEQLE